MSSTQSDPTPSIAVSDRALTHERSAFDLRRAGRPTDAAGEALRAVSMWRHALNILPRMQVLPSLARSLSNGSILLAEADHDEGAMQMAEEALALREELVAHDRATHLPALAQSLLIVSVGLGERQRSAEALVKAAELVAVYRELSAVDRATYLPHLATSEYNLGMRLSAVGRKAEALEHAREALQLRRALVASDRETFLPDLAATLEHVSGRLTELGQRESALEAATEALELYRGLCDSDRGGFLTAMARCLGSIGNRLGDVGRHAEAMEATREAVAIHRELVAREGARHLSDLALCLNRLGGALVGLGRHAEALQVMQEATQLHRDLAAADRPRFLSDLAGSVDDIAVTHTLLGNRPDALAMALEGLQLNRELHAIEGDARSADLARSLSNVSAMLGDLGRMAEAVDSAREAVALYRGLHAAHSGAFGAELARGLHNLARALDFAGVPSEALGPLEEALRFRQQLAASHRAAFLPDLAMSLDAQASILAKLGRREDSLRAAHESVELYRELTAVNGRSYSANLAASINTLSASFARLHRYDEAVLAVNEAITVYRQMAATEPQLQAMLRMCLRNLSDYLGRLGRASEAHAAARESVDLARELVRYRRASPADLAGSLDNLAFRLADLGRNEEALVATREGVQITRELVASDRDAHLLSLASALRSLGIRSKTTGRKLESDAAYRECAALVLELPPDDPRLWTAICQTLSSQLDSWSDVRDWYIPLLTQLTEHRELAWDSEHASILLSFQSQLAARIWQLLPTLPAEEGALLDDALARLFAALQSPDLSRWLDARGTADGSLAKLAELKREVIEAEQLLATLRARPSDDDRGMRTGLLPAPDGREAPMHITDQATTARMLREAFRDERARLAADEPRFASAFAPLGPQALRSIASHAGASALLCLLELRTDASPDVPQTGHKHVVAALLHANGRRTQLLQLPDLSEVASLAERHVAGEQMASRRGPLRSAPVQARRSTGTTDQTPAINDLLSSRMTHSFWTPLRQALADSGVSVERLHICLHGTTQQLPLALRKDDDCVGVHVVAWPGLPYLRRAVRSTSINSTGDATAPWLVGHDCAWETEQPLPMVAVEAALLRRVLSGHGRAAQSIGEAARLHGRASAFVACCHGGAERAQFEHALHLGQEPLTVRQILQQPVGPPLALLPACYAGRTDEDAAGNALGVAAAFMLSGTRVVVASSKAVPDLLQPWLSTLMVWHMMQGLPHHEAAHRARELFARLEFPGAYRDWLQDALPQALATIQPGGDEDRSIRGPRAQLALETVTQCWPWQGETQHLFSADPRLRAEATRSVVAGILKPRACKEGARDLAAEVREVAAFVFIYGVD